MTDQSPPDRPIARVDTRRRVTLPKEHAAPGRMFFLDVDEQSGVISLTPAVAVPVWAVDAPFENPTAD